MLSQSRLNLTKMKEKMFNFLKNDQKDTPIKTPGYGVDFHMHTLASDGLWTPEKLVSTAIEQGLKTMTVSDHDTIKNVNAVRTLARQNDIEFVPGVEITINWKKAVYHLLVFNYDETDPAFNAMLHETQQAMETKKQGILQGLQSRGYKLDKLDAVRRENGEYLAIDIARALHKGREVASFDHAIAVCQEFGLGTICSQSADKAFAISVAAGGVPVLAHPGRAEWGIHTTSLDTLREFMEFGLAGVEVYHYTHTPEDIARYLNFARQNELAISAGSDSHTEARKPTPWNPELTSTLLERLNLRRPVLTK